MLVEVGHALHREHALPPPAPTQKRGLYWVRALFAYTHETVFFFFSSLAYTRLGKPRLSRTGVSRVELRAPLLEKVGRELVVGEVVLRREDLAPTEIQASICACGLPNSYRKSRFHSLRFGRWRVFWKATNRRESFELSIVTRARPVSTTSSKLSGIFNGRRPRRRARSASPAISAARRPTSRKQKTAATPPT